jgi:acyl carrier protein
MIDRRLEEELRRAPAGTKEALSVFKATSAPEALEIFIRGIVARNIDESYEEILEQADENTHFVDDLGIDSLTIIEIVMTLEDGLEIELVDNALKELQTFKALKSYIIQQRAEINPNNEAAE